MQELQILLLTSLYTIQPFIHLKKQLNRPEHNHNYTLTSEIHSHATRYSSQQHIFLPHTKHYSKIKEPARTVDHLPAIHTKIWNSIPAGIRDIKSLKLFKDNLKLYLLKSQNI